MKLVNYFFMLFILFTGVIACNDDDNKQTPESEDQVEKVGVTFGEMGRTVLRNGGKVQIPVVLEKPAGAMVRVHVAPVVSSQDSVAEEGIDFLLEEKVINIPAGETTGYVNVDILDNGKVTRDKVVDLVIKTVYGAGEKFTEQQTFRLAITSNSFVEFEKTAWTTYESAATNEGYKTTCRIPLRITGVVLAATTIEVAVSDSSAMEYQHFELASKKITVNPGDEMAYIELIPKDDNMVNYDRIFSLSLSAVSGGNLVIGKLKATCRVTIVSEEVVKTARFKVAEITGTEGKTIEMAVLLDHAPSETEDPVVVTIEPVEADGNAVAGTDYQLSAQALTFGPGEKEKAIEIVLAEDNDLYDKEFSLTLKSAVGAEVSKAPLKIRIQNNDFPYFKGTSYTTQPEGSGTNIIPVCIPGKLDYDVTLHLEAVAVTAVEGKHFTFKNKTVVIKAGETEGSVSFDVLGIPEWKETPVFEIKINAVDEYPVMKDIHTKLSVVKNEGYRKWLGNIELKMGNNTYQTTLSAGSTDEEIAANFGKYYFFNKVNGRDNWRGKLQYSPSSATEGTVAIVGASSGYRIGQYDFNDGRGPLDGGFVWRIPSLAAGSFYTSNCALQANGSTLSIASDVTLAFFWYKGTSAIYNTDAMTVFSITKR